MNDVVKWERNISTFMTAEFICIKVRSGRGMGLADPTSEGAIFVINVEDHALGEAISAGLNQSRLVTSEIFNEWHRSSRSRYESWVNMLLERFKYKSRRAMFKTMKSCSVMLNDNGFSFQPLKHEKLEGWGRTEGDGIEDLHLPADATATELGAALRLAFDRCT